MQEFVHNTTGEGFEHTPLPLVQWSELVQGFLEFLPTHGLSLLPESHNGRDRVTHREPLLKLPDFLPDELLSC
jgi:hypothetical protein